MKSFYEIVEDHMDGKSQDEKIDYLRTIIVSHTQLLHIIIDNLPDDVRDKIIDETGLLKTKLTVIK